jgi:hypothetical protein
MGSHRLARADRRVVRDHNADQLPAGLEMDQLLVPGIVGATA